LAKLAKLTKLT